jgi:secreted trypsin-like serine protease
MSMQRSFVSFVAVMALLAGCGTHDADSSATKVVGGHRATPPGFLASLSDEKGDTAFCGGTFIEANVVVTAAHCAVDQTKPMAVSAGLARNENLAAQPKIRVKAIVVHPGFDHDTMQNDIALLVLDDYDASAQPGPIKTLPLNETASLPESQGQATVYGFGNESSYGDLFEPELNAAELPIIPTAKCAAQDGYDKVTNGQICAGLLETGGLDSCQGDSGGPLVATDASGKTSLVGIVSWGQGCAQKRKPGVYTRVSDQASWVRKTLAGLRAAAPTLAADVLDRSLPAYCYDHLATTTLTTPSPTRQLTVNELFNVKGAFRPLASGATTGASTSKECQATLPGGARLAAHAERVGAKLVVRAGAPGAAASFEADAERAVNAKVVCLDASPRIGFLYDPSGMTYGSVGGRMVVATGAAAGLPSSGARHDCEVAGMKVTIVETHGLLGEDAAVIAVSGSVVGGTRYFRGAFAGGSDPDLALGLKLSADGKSGDATLANNGQDDVFSWQLACSAPFSLTDATGHRTEARIGPDGVFVQTLLAPSPGASIGKGGKVSFKLAAAKPIDAAKLQCQLNGRPVAVVKL